MSSASRQRKCRLASCDKTVTGTSLFCRPHYYALPKELQRGLWKPLYGGAEHIKACLKHLST